MSFDDIPEDREASFPCPLCGGDITNMPELGWVCNQCDWVPDKDLC